MQETAAYAAVVTLPNYTTSEQQLQCQKVTH